MNQRRRWSADEESQRVECINQLVGKGELDQQTAERFIADLTSVEAVTIYMRALTASPPPSFPVSNDP